MPKCTVVGCRTGYKGQKKGLQTFTLPKSKQFRELWLRKINRENFTPSNSTVVCERHFRVTGKSFSEALILASTNPQYDKRLFIELRVQYIKTTQIVFLF